jgi:transposase
MEGKTMIITVRTKSKGIICKLCGRRITTIHNYLAPSRIKHMFWAGNQIELELKKKCYFCWSCKKRGKIGYTTVERTKMVPRGKRYSLVYANQIMQGLGSTSFKTQQQISEGSFTTLQGILRSRINPFIGVWNKEETTTAIGLDCHSFSGIKMLPTITDITNHRLITILPNDKRQTVKSFLSNMPTNKKEQIKEVCIDMDTHYLSAIREELPNARIVVDFFHIVADANKRITDTRTVIQRGCNVKLPKKLFDKSKEYLTLNERAELNNIFIAYPELGALWRVKEKIRNIHKLPSTALATISYGALLGRMKVSLYPSVRSWAKTLYRWQDSILAYFENYTTNGYTEGVNTKLKTIKRLSYGFKNIDNYIRKAMLAFIPISLLIVTHYLT